jgi:hypothetical protein
MFTCKTFKSLVPAAVWNITKWVGPYLSAQVFHLKLCFKATLKGSDPCNRICHIPVTARTLFADRQDAVTVWSGPNNSWWVPGRITVCFTINNRKISVFFFVPGISQHATFSPRAVDFWVSFTQCRPSLAEQWVLATRSSQRPGCRWLAVKAHMVTRSTLQTLPACCTSFSSEVHNLPHVEDQTDTCFCYQAPWHFIKNVT